MISQDAKTFDMVERETSSPQIAATQVEHWVRRSSDSPLFSFSWLL